MPAHRPSAVLPSEKITTRLSPQLLARMDALLFAVSSRLGKAATRTDVIREAIVLGLEQMESDQRKLVKRLQTEREELTGKPF